MNTFCIKSFLLAGVVFYSLTSSAQTINKSPSMLHMKRENRATLGRQDFTPKFRPSIVTTANKTEINNPIIDTRDIRIFPSPNIQSEVNISINKTDPNNIIASANTLLGVKFGQILYNQGYYFTYDGGKSWSGSDVLQNAPTQEVFGDPATAFAADGTAFLTTIHFNQEFLGSYFFQSSATGGNTWSTATDGTNGYLSSGFDKPMCAADNDPKSRYKNNFYNSWTDFGIAGGEVVVNRSTDRGFSFSTPTIIRTNVNGFGQGTSMQTGPNGEVYVCWADHATVTFPFQADAIGFSKSTNGGISFEVNRNVFSFDGIRTSAADSTFNSSGVFDFPSMGVDKSSGAYKGRIYIAYPTKNSSGDSSVIQVRYSKDKGTNWSDPVTVSIRDGRQNFFPWIAVDDSTGDVWATYYSFDQPKGFATNTYVALSQDGGATWKNKKVSDVSHVTAPIDDNYFRTGYIGDYIGIAAYAGKAYPIWMDNRNGTWQIYCSPVSIEDSSKRIEPVGKPVSPAIVTNKRLAWPNPFRNEIHLNMADNEFTTVELFNEAGMLFKRWNNVNTHTLDVARLPRGVYNIKVVDKNLKVYTQTIIKE